MISRELVAVEDFGPGIPVRSHDGSTASLDNFAQAAAGVDAPGEGMGIAAPLGSSWQQAEGFAAAQGCASGYQQLLWCVRGVAGGDDSSAWSGRVGKPTAGNIAFLLLRDGMLMFQRDAPC